jgi:hypothetical protein
MTATSDRAHVVAPPPLIATAAVFSFISMNWRGRPLVSHEVVIQLIAATTTGTGLKVKARADTRRYPDKIKVSDAEMAQLNLERDPFHGEWNYPLKPRA